MLEDVTPHPVIDTRFMQGFKFHYFWHRKRLRQPFITLYKPFVSLLEIKLTSGQIAQLVPCGVVNKTLRQLLVCLL